MIALRKEPAFELGEIYVSHQATSLLSSFGLDPTYFVNRHVHCDWSQLSVKDRFKNKIALSNGNKIVSAYTLNSKDKNRSIYLFLSTDADRDQTIIMLSEEVAI